MFFPLAPESLLLLVISLVLGGIIGGLLKIEYNLDKLGDSIEKKFSKDSSGGFAEGFVIPIALSSRDKQEPFALNI